MARSKSSDDAETTRSNRLIIPLTSENEIDWESVRPSMKEQLLNTVNNDVTVLEHIGMSHESGGSGDGDGAGDFEGDITLANVRAFLDGLTKTNAIAMTLIIPKVLAHPIKSRLAGHRVPFQIDKDIALQNFVLTEEQHKELDPRAERLARKYIPATAKKHLDVIMLASMYVSYMTGNIKATIEAQINRDISIIKHGPSTAPPQAPVESDNKVPPNGHAPESVQPPPTTEEVSPIESLEPGNEPRV